MFPSSLEDLGGRDGKWDLSRLGVGRALRGPEPRVEGEGGTAFGNLVEIYAGNRKRKNED